MPKFLYVTNSVARGDGPVLSRLRVYAAGFSVKPALYTMLNSPIWVIVSHSRASDGIGCFGMLVAYNNASKPVAHSPTFVSLRETTVFKRYALRNRSPRRLQEPLGVSL